MRSISAILCLVMTQGLTVLPFTANGQVLTDTHIHYSHDAWEVFPPTEAIGLLRSAGLKRAFVSSSSDDGTQKLHAAAPDLIVPVLRPYRRRGEIGTWMHDPEILVQMDARLRRNTYAGIGEFHAYGDDIETDVLQGVIRLASQYDLFLHAHSDAEAIDRIFRSDPNARVLWAHSGFDRPEKVARMLRKHPNLWADLAFRSDQARLGKVDRAWRKVFRAFPDRMMIGTDTYTPERWPFVPEHADWSRQWLSDLPPELAERIAWRNAEALLQSGKGWK